MRKTERGQNLIEFALLMPIVLVFVAALIIFGLALFYRSSMQQAVREGARQAAVGKTLAEVQSLAAGNSPDSLDANEVYWCLPSGSSGSVGDSIRVFVDDDSNHATTGLPYELVPAAGIIRAIGVPSLTVRLDPKATARLEKSVSGVPPCT